MANCEVDTCDRPMRAKRLCDAHYTRQRLGLNLSDAKPLRIYGDDAARFWSKVAPAGADDCWLWTGARTKAGYGQINIARKPVYAHRWAYEHLRTDIPDGLELDHTCEVRACVNPWHLEPVTHAENIRRIFSRERTA